ncbi:MAG: HDIG domain-containing protein [Candidatus Latescibacteria bacterium]|nr:HDIG domain-containing protein [Candidatus Latescibacterota bacterium]
MTQTAPTRQQAIDLLHQYNSNPSLINHALAVEAAMRHQARKAGQDEEMWGLVGLIHDLDYEQFPEQHCQQTEAILRQHQWPEEYIRAALSHGWGICTQVEPQSLLEKTLYTVDELAGFVTACALVRPSKSVADLTVKSVKKKWKQKAFAAGVDRQLVERGAAMLDRDLDEITADVIEALRQVADEIGL